MCQGRGCICQSCHGPSRMVARYLYGIVFLLTVIIAWMIRDYSKKALGDIQYLKGCNSDPNCLGTEGVLRVSLGGFAFYFLMYLTTVGTKTTDDSRDAWHSGFWPIKCLLWIILMVVPFFIPSAAIQIYGEIARFGAGIFLIIQLLSLINFLYWWNENWLSEKNERSCRIPMVLVTFLSYGVSLLGLVLMYIWFTPRPSCGTNIFFVTWTLILVLLMTFISLHTKVNSGLLISSLMSLYIVFLCYSAIMSEPVSVTCNTRHRQTGKGDLVTIFSFILACMAIISSTYSTGIDSKSFSFRKDVEACDGVPYGYGFFHFVFAMGAMYFAMLFVGWDLNQTIHRWSIDVGWASVWVKIVNEWLAALLYIWTMVGPFIMTNRDFT